ncbi:MAG: energy transducer TonB [Acidobacteriia bacterium]|nr:energy transducer TonB [Terriglobia bacterium]
MATAFTAEAIVGGLLVVIPLLSTGVIPVSARVLIYTPVKPVTLDRVERVRTDHASASGPARSGPRTTAVFTFNNHQSTIPDRPWSVPIGEPPTPGPQGGGNQTDKQLSDFMSDGPSKTNVKFGGPKRVTSQLSEGQLVNRVEPIYPHIAAVSGIQGQVKLHAIIGRDGKIQSLNAISGHPLLLHAALDAVAQWRYRPYVLNGEAVEVETFITVNFKKEMH